VLKVKAVIIGGGFGGMFTAKKLHNICRGDLDIELISKINYFTYQPLLPEVAGKKRRLSTSAHLLRAAKQTAGGRR